MQRKIDKLGRIVLPMEIRKKLNIKTGDALKINVNGRHITLSPEFDTEFIKDMLVGLSRNELQDIYNALAALVKLKTVELGRRYIGFENNKKWFDVAQNRLNKIDAKGQIGMFLK